MLHYDYHTLLNKKTVFVVDNAARGVVCRLLLRVTKGRDFVCINFCAVNSDGKSIVIQSASCFLLYTLFMIPRFAISA